MSSSAGVDQEFRNAPICNFTNCLRVTTALYAEGGMLQDMKHFSRAMQTVHIREGVFVIP